MLRSLAAAIFLSIMVTESVAQVPLDNFPISRNPITGVATTDIPQFVVLTIQNRVVERTMQDFRVLSEIRNRYGCGIKATFFAYQHNFTECNMVSALLKGEHEIASGSFYSTATSPADIDASRSFLINQCEVPAAELGGFRAPSLIYDEQILTHLYDTNFVYDSSLAPDDAEDSVFGRNNLWPYTLDQGEYGSDPAAGGGDAGGGGGGNTGTGPDTTIPDFGNIGLRAVSLPLRGMWQVPIGRLYDTDDTMLRPIDFSNERIEEILDLNLARHMNGNRAPLHIAVTGPWLNANKFALKTWIEDVNAANNDVFFVTINDVLKYMRNPKTTAVYRPRCTDQGPCYTPLPAECVFGEFDTNACNCVCTEGYCLDDVGTCTRTSGCGDIDGGWSDWDKSRPCCQEKRLIERACTNPQPQGNGADCIGDALMTENCFPEDCPNGGYTEWSSYTECCGGIQSRTRECLAPPSINNGRGCGGVTRQDIECFTEECDQKYYPDFSRTSCDLSTVAPVGADPFKKYNSCEDCCGATFSWALSTCVDGCQNPPVHGGWSAWSKLGPCCDAEQLMSRSCTEPRPANGGENCVGESRIVQTCVSEECNNDGWGEWTEWSDCCERSRSRTRQCLRSSGLCEGEASESEFCAVDTCPTFYSPNYAQGICIRIVDINDPKGATTSIQYDSAEACCAGDFDYDMEKCLAKAVDPVDGGWSEWGQFNLCCNGEMFRVRTCSNPRPKHGGLDCEGEATEIRQCSEDNCPEYTSGAASSLASVIMTVAAALVLGGWDH